MRVDTEAMQPRRTGELRWVSDGTTRSGAVPKSRAFKKVVNNVLTYSMDKPVLSLALLWYIIGSFRAATRSASNRNTGRNNTTRKVSDSHSDRDILLDA